MSLLSLFYDFDRMLSSSLVPVDLGSESMLRVASERTETDSDVTYTYELPGVEKSQLTVSAKNGFLVVTAEKTCSEQRPNYTERSYGKFNRTVRLGPGYDVNQATSKFENGVLTVRVPKTTEAALEKKIEIQ